MRFSALYINKNIESNRRLAGALIRIVGTKVSAQCRHRRATLYPTFIISTRSTAAGHAFPVLLVHHAKVFHTTSASRTGRPLMYIRSRFRTGGESSINICPFSIRTGFGRCARSSFICGKSIDIFQRFNMPPVSRRKIGIRSFYAP